jgi:integrase
MLDTQLSLTQRTPDLDSLVAKASQYMDAAKAPATRKAYKSDARFWMEFCAIHALPYLPSSPEAVVLYISDLASRGVTVATIKRRLAAITDLHRAAGADSPSTPGKHFVLHEVLAGIKRTIGAAQHGADPISSDAIRRIAAACPATLLGTRDRALCLLGFSMGARRSELASIMEVRDLTFTDQGLYVVLRHSKTSQFGDDPRPVAVPYGQHPETSPVLAVRAWMQAGKIHSGALFRAVDRHGNVSSFPLNPRSIAKILARASGRAGIDVAIAHISPHSLRVGMVTTAAVNGAKERDIARITGHRSVRMVRRYIRDANLFRNNASGRLGL